jgi:hypothetical protein
MKFLTMPISSYTVYIQFFDQITFEDLQWVFLNWMERLSWVVEHDSAYSQE